MGRVLVGFSICFLVFSCSNHELSTLNTDHVEFYVPQINKIIISGYCGLHWPFLFWF